MNNKILVTGGAGYIGSHTCIELHQAGYDNLSNNSYEAVNRISTLIGQPIEFIKGNIRNCRNS
jgi:UDP-glucose 4-epimerase